MPVEPPPCVWDLPDPADAEPGQDVVAIGADLSASTVLAAYRRGIFPMHLGVEEHPGVDEPRAGVDEPYPGERERHLDTGELAWWSPDPRGILPLDGLRVTRSLRKSIRRYRVSCDEAFVDVMRACADERRDGVWITDEFIDTYSELHRLGWAHSIEVWSAADELVGGLYGIEVGGLFAGESMFHRERDASKVALVALVDRLAAGGGDRLLDVQWKTEHLASLGAVEVPRVRYLDLLSRATRLRPCLGPPGGQVP